MISSPVLKAFKASIVKSTRTFVADSVIYKDANGRFRALNKAGKPISKIEFDEVLPFYEKLSGVKIARKVGFINLSGQVVIPAKFDDASSFSEGLAAVKMGEKWGYINKSGMWVIKPQYEEASFFSDGLAVAKNSGKWGYIDKLGKVAIPFQYTSANRFIYGVAGVKSSLKSSSNRLISKKDEVVGFADGIWNDPDKSHEKSYWHTPITRDKDAPPPVEELREVDTEQIELYYNGGKVGLRNESEGELLPANYDRIYTYGADHYAFESKNKSGLYVKGKGIVLPLSYDLMTDVNDGYILVTKDKKSGVYKKGQGFILPVNSYGINYHRHGIFSVCHEWNDPLKNPEYKLFDSNGRQIGENKYYGLEEFVNGFAKVLSTKNEFGLIDTLGREVVPAVYSDLRSFKYDNREEGFVNPRLIAVRKDDKFGYVDFSGKEVVPFIYRDVPEYCPVGMIVEDDGSKQALFDLTVAKETTPFIYTELRGLQPCMLKRFKAKSVENGKYAILDRTGKTIVQPIYDGIEWEYRLGRILVSTNDKWGVLDFGGNLIFPIQIDKRFVFNGDGTAIVQINGKAVKIDLDGKIVK